MITNKNPIQPTVCHLSSVHNWFDERVFHKEMKSLRKIGYKVSFVVQQKQNVQVDGIQIVALKKPRSFFHRIFFTNAVLLIRALQIRADAYHFHDSELLFIGYLLKCLGKRVIYDTHENYQEKFRAHPRIPDFLRPWFSALWWMFEKSISSRFDFVITADSVTKRKFPQGKVEVLGNFPPRDFGKVHQSAGSSSFFKIIYVGGITEERGIGKAVDAVERLDDIPVKLHLIGETRNPSLLRRISNHPKVVYHGRIEWEKLGPHLASADIGIALYQPIPSYLYYPGENIVKLFEYMKMGIPVLLSAFPLLKPFIEQIGAGIPVDPADPEKIAEAIRHLYHHPEIRREMGQKGINAVNHTYNWENQEKKLWRVYERVLSQ